MTFTSKVIVAGQVLAVLAQVLVRIEIVLRQRIAAHVAETLYMNTALVILVVVLVIFAILILANIVVRIDTEKLGRRGGPAHDWRPISP